MKNLLLLALFIGVFSSNLWAQAPQAVCYQALAKDNQNNNILESTIGVRATIVSGGANGVSEWIEVHTPQTDQFGLFTIEIGQGNAVLGGVQSSFGDIEWGNGEYWLRIEFDPFNAGNYQLMGATKIISVPYALYAEGANTANTAIYANSAQTSDTALVALTTLGDDDSDPLNELQTLSFQNGELSILAPDGSLVGAPVPLGVSTGGSLDDSNTNELQNLVSQNGQLFLEDENSNTTGSGVAFDESNTNELQTLSIDGNIISLSGGNSIELNSTDIPFTAPGSSFDLPQGIYGQYVVKGSGSFTVPADKTFWITAGGPVVKLKGLGVVPFVIHSTTPNMPVLPSGQIVQDCMCTGVLVDNSTMLEPLVINFIQDEFYTVPEGKVLFVKSGLANDEIGYLKVNNEPMEFLRSNFTRSTQIIAFPAGTLVEPIASNVGDLILTGFLIDEAF